MRTYRIPYRLMPAGSRFDATIVGEQHWAVNAAKTEGRLFYTIPPFDCFVFGCEAVDSRQALAAMRSMLELNRIANDHLIRFFCVRNTKEEGTPCSYSPGKKAKKSSSARTSGSRSVKSAATR